MKTLHDSAVGDFTRGGQVTMHFLRMIRQVALKLLMLAILLYIVLTAGMWWVHTQSEQRYLGVRYVGAEIGVFLENGRKPAEVTLPDGSDLHTTIQAIANSTAMQDTAWGLLDIWLHCMVEAAYGTAVVLLFFFVWLFHFGKTQREELMLRGAELVEGKELAAILKKRKLAGDLKFGDIPLVKDSETGHILFMGSSGTGKTTGYHELMRQIRDRGDRAICFSPSGDFISWFYRPDKDKILNVFDARTPSWDMWRECDMPYHYPMIAASLIPTPAHGEKIWAEAAQSLVAVLMRTMHERGNDSIPEMLKIVTRLPMPSIYEYLRDTEVAANLDPSNERMGASIRSTAVIALRSLTYLRETEERFTIKDWVLGPDNGSWMFLNAKADQLDASRPVLTTWLEIFVNRTLSLSEDRKRRIWLIIDELPTLNKLNSLSMFVEQSRKFGGCGMLGIQQYSQLTHIYGREQAAAIIGQCNTWICYRQNDPESAKFVSEKFGKVEVEENQQGLSYGANDMRDGVSLSQQRKEREVVMPSEIMKWKNLSGLVKLVGDLPAGRFQLKRGNIKTIAEAFVAPVVDPLDAILQLDKSQLIDLSGDDESVQPESEAVNETTVIRDAEPEVDPQTEHTDVADVVEPRAGPDKDMRTAI